MDGISEIRRSGLRITVLSSLVVAAAAMGWAQGGASARVHVARLADVIHPISAEYLVGAIAEAEAARADLIVVQIDTPGGLDTSMREIVQAFLNSPIPVCLFVGPQGARAGSAGFFMAMAADLVAMAPGTNMGAASPVPVGGGEVDETMARKLMQDAEAYIRSLAEQHGRPADLAAAAVTEGRSFAAAEAIETGLADLQADDIEDLLAALDGRQVTKGRQTSTLATAEAEVVLRDPSLRQRILSIIANPQVALVLLLVGMGGMYFELSTPGAVLPGVVGGVSLVLALLAFQILPINYAGLALLALAVLFFILEIKVTSYGLLTVAGLVAFVLGALMLVPGPIPELRLQLPFVLPVALSVAGIAMFLVWLVLNAHRAQVATGPAGLVSEIGSARTPLGPDADGKVFVHGELWKARSDEAVSAGQAVEVLGVEDGMVIRVRPRSVPEDA